MRRFVVALAGFAFLVAGLLAIGWTQRAVAQSAGCSCTRTGAFTAPVSGLKLSPFTDPTGATSFAITPGPSPTDLVVTATRGAGLSAANVADWGVSPGRQAFYVIGKPSGNDPVPVDVYRVSAAGLSHLLSFSMRADGYLKFSPDGGLMVTVEARNETGALATYATIYDLDAAAPSPPRWTLSGLSPTAPIITFSPCEDMAMVFYWTQSSPAAGEAQFRARANFSSAEVITRAASTDQTTGAAQLVSAPGGARTITLSHLRLLQGGDSFAAPSCPQSAGTTTPSQGGGASGSTGNRYSQGGTRGGGGSSGGSVYINRGGGGGVSIPPVCGFEGGRACHITERTPSCDRNLVESGGRCIHPNCGRLDGAVCTVNQRIPSCDDDLVEVNGVCRTRLDCGGEGGRACLIVERTPSCDANLVESAGRCIHPNCGRNGQRACAVWERIPSCDGGLREDWGRCRQ